VKAVRENDYQSALIQRLRAMFPGCFILKNDSRYVQGIPDLLLLFQDKWAAFEVKASNKAPYQANQQYYVELLNDMSFAARITPQNEAEVLHALQHSFAATRPTRFLKRK
jgi:hypothetical protein